MLAIPLTPMVAWAVRIALPIHGRDWRPDRWRRRSLGAVAVYVGAYLLGTAALFVLFDAAA